MDTNESDQRVGFDLFVEWLEAICSHISERRVLASHDSSRIDTDYVSIYRGRGEDSIVSSFHVESPIGKHQSNEFAAPIDSSFVVKSPPLGTAWHAIADSYNDTFGRSNPLEHPRKRSGTGLSDYSDRGRSNNNLLMDFDPPQVGASAWADTASVVIRDFHSPEVANLNGSDSLPPSDTNMFFMKNSDNNREMSVSIDSDINADNEELVALLKTAETIDSIVVNISDDGDVDTSPKSLTSPTSTTSKSSSRNIRNFLSSSLPMKAKKPLLPDLTTEVENIVMDITRRLAMNLRSDNLSDNDVFDLRFELDDLSAIFTEFWDIFTPRNGIPLTDQERAGAIESLENWFDNQMECDIEDGDGDGDGVSIRNFIEWLGSFCENISDTRILNESSIINVSDVEPNESI